MASYDPRTVPFTALHHGLSSFCSPSQQIVLPESTPAGYFTSHPDAPCYPVAQGNLGSPTTQLVHPQRSGQSSRTAQGTCSPQILQLPSSPTKGTATSPVTPLPSFRELVQHIGSSAPWALWPENDDQNPLRDIESHSQTSPQLIDRRPLNSSSTSLQLVFSPEIGYRPMPHGAEPRFWTGFQPLVQHSLHDRSNRELTPMQNLGAATPGFPIPIPIMAQGGNGAWGSHCHLSASEGPRVNGREIIAHNQDVSRHSSPISMGVNGKRKWVPHSSDGTNSPSKRQAGATNRVMLDMEKDIHHTQQTNGGGLFSNASNFTINDSKMTAVGVQHVYIRNGGPGPITDPALVWQLWLKKQTMKGAEHNSGDRDPPPRCHPGTRTTIIQNVQDWLENSEREKNLLWLRGAAGVGKSAIVQTIAESLSETGRLGASLFFSRPNGRSNPRRIFPTLAYRFAVQDPLYREYIVQLMQTDPESLDKAMSEQFQILIVEPFVSKGIRSGKMAWTVTLDGLDECGEDPNGRRHSNDVQRDVVRLISDFVRRYPAAPLIWVIASRPEVHLKAVFSELDVAPSFWEQDVPVDSTEACEDVEKFLHKEFKEIGQKYPDHILDSPWPAQKQFLKIAHAALGLFIFAETVVRFIGDPEVGNPIGQLECVLVAISEMRSQSQENPLAKLDLIYLAILFKIPRSTLQVTKRLLGFLIYLNEKDVIVSYCNFRLMCQILDISKDIGVTALLHLHSVLYFPRSKDIGETLPRFYHASFRDFLVDKSRSHEHFIDNAFTVDQFTQGFIRVAQSQFSSDPDSRLSPLSGETTPDDCFSQFVKNVLLGIFSSDGVHMKRGVILIAYLPDAQLQSLLEDFSAIKIFKYAKYPFNPHNWNFREQDEYELSRRGFLHCTTFGSLGIDWHTVSVSISKLGPLNHHAQVDTTPGIQNESHANCPEVQEFRRRSKATASNTKVRVWGHRKSGCRLAVVNLGDGSDLDYYAITGIPLVNS